MSIKNKNKFKFFNLLLPITILAYFLSMLKAWWPGQMSRDSLDQYLMSLNILPISDWHPPVMALLWRFLNHIIGISSPSTLFVFHLLLYLLGLYLCIIYLTKNNFVRVLIFIIFCAFISSQQIVIWKDTGMVGALLIAIGSSLMLTKTKINWKKNTLLFFGIFSLVYATSIRWNVLPSIVLVSFLLIYSYFGQKLKPKIFPLSFVLLGFLFISSNLLNYSLVKVEKTYPLQHIFIYDIVGVSVRSTGETKNRFSN